MALVDIVCSSSLALCMSEDAFLPLFLDRPVVLCNILASTARRDLLPVQEAPQSLPCCSNSRQCQPGDGVRASGPENTNIQGLL